MQDRDKTRAQLAGELRKLRVRVEELEAQLGGEAPRRERRSGRSALQTQIRFTGDFGLVQAQGVDLSEGGVCFDLEQSMCFEMEFDCEGEKHHHQAKLVWMRALPREGYRFGFEFVPQRFPGLLWAYKDLEE